MNMQVEEKKWVSAIEAAKQLGISYQTILRWIESGYLPATKFGPRKWRISTESIDSLIRGGDQSTVSEK